MIAEYEVHRGRSLFVAMDVVELLRGAFRQPAVAVASEERSGAASEHAFIGGHPLDSETVGDGQHLFGDASFRRPHALGTHPEHLLV